MPRGREVEEIEKRRRRPEGWRESGRGSRHAGSVTKPAIGRGGPPWSRCTSTSRSASRSARTATSSWLRDRPPAGRRRGSRRCSEALRAEVDLRADALDAGSGPRPAAARIPLRRRRHAVAPPGRRVAGLLNVVAAPNGLPTTPRSRSRRTRARTSGATPSRSRGRASAGCRSARRRCRRPGCAGWVGLTGSDDGDAAVAAAREAGIARSASISCTTCPTGRWSTG